MTLHLTKDELDDLFLAVQRILWEYPENTENHKEWKKLLDKLDAHYEQGEVVAKATTPKD